VHDLLRSFVLSVLVTAFSATAWPADRSAIAAAIDRAAQAAISAGESPGLQVAVYKDGEPLLVKGYGSANLELNVPVGNDNVFRIGSVTKQFTAAALLKLEEEGRLSTNDRLSRYYPSYPRAADITLAQMLHHTSGLHNYTDDAVLLEREAGLALTTDQWVERFARMPKTQDFEPGTGWSYSNTAYFLLGGVIEKVEGKPL
jgi:D-alanyl-D-alanine carboxypeptidase